MRRSSSARRTGNALEPAHACRNTGYLAGARPRPTRRAGHLVTGSGERFCVGGDSQALDGLRNPAPMNAGTPADLVTPGDTSFAPFARLAYHFAWSQPVITAINGARRRARPRARLLWPTSASPCRGPAHHRATARSTATE